MRRYEWITWRRDTVPAVVGVTAGLTHIMDSAAVDGLDGELSAVKNDCQGPIIFSLQGLQFASRKMLGRLRALSQALREDGRCLIICSAPPEILRDLDAAGWTEEFTIAEDVRAALSLAQ